MNPSTGSTIGVDLGGTKVIAAILGPDGALTARHTVATGASFTPAMLIEFVAAVRATASMVAIEAIGIGFPGLVDSDSGRVLSSVILPTWKGADLGESMSDHLGIACVVANDVHNAARAEAHVRGASDPDLFFVSVGTGIGGAWFARRAVQGGASGLAGEIGHMVVSDHPRCACGRDGCVGALASGRAIESRLGLDPGALEDRMRDPSPGDVTVVREAGTLLGRALANLIHLIHPPLVVVGGGVAEIPGYVESAAATATAEVMDEFSPRPRIERARAGYDAGLLGSALLGRAMAGASGAAKGRRP